MNRIFYFLIFIAAFSTSCRRDGDGYKKKVYDRLHGKYKPVSSITSQPVDVNRDGVAGTNLLSEFNYPGYCDLVIRISDKFYLDNFWPEQYITYGNNPEPVINYNCQGLVYSFSIASDNSTLLLDPDNYTRPDPNTWVTPDAITIEGNDLIKVVITKKLFTISGWQQVTITTVYERYTMVT